MTEVEPELNRLREQFIDSETLRAGEADATDEAKKQRGRAERAEAALKRVRARARRHRPRPRPASTPTAVLR
ncbi:hypothetical protein [Streptomyces sp. 6N223]|uniref:hypothetical protein n=1 Tax=Streptomyces sp. 6N223 TaxID=3457412 RepID=UPI003FCF569F